MCSENFWSGLRVNEGGGGVDIHRFRCWQRQMLYEEKGRKLIQQTISEECLTLIKRDVDSVDILKPTPSSEGPKSWEITWSCTCKYRTASWGYIRNKNYSSRFVLSGWKVTKGQRQDRFKALSCNKSEICALKYRNKVRLYLYVLYPLVP